MPLRKKVERLRRIGHVAEEFVARDAGQALGAALAEPLIEAHVGQFGQNRQPSVQDLEPFERQQERVPHSFDSFQCLELLRCELIVVVSVDDLNSFFDAAWSFGAPHLGIAARADPLRQRVARQDDITSLGAGRHEIEKPVPLHGTT